MPSAPDPAEVVRAAYVDPADPTTLYLTQVRPPRPPPPADSPVVVAAYVEVAIGRRAFDPRATAYLRRAYLRRVGRRLRRASSAVADGRRSLLEVAIGRRSGGADLARRPDTLTWHADLSR
eukprot:526428-Prorocentrum_minimum.AAC.1